jgi:hypothetical protein
MKFKCIPTTFLSFNWQLYLRIYNLNQMFAFIYNRTMAAIGNHYDPISRSDIITMILSQWVILSLWSYLNEWYCQYDPISMSDIITMILSQWVILSLWSYLNEWYYHYHPISMSDIININQLTWILKIVSQCDVKHIMKLLIKKTMSDLYH